MSKPVTFNVDMAKRNVNVPSVSVFLTGFVFVLMLTGVLLKNINIQNVEAGSSKSYSVTLKVGWNAIALPLETDLTAKKACTQIENAVYIAKYKGSDWQYFECAKPNKSENFKLEFNRGYFVRVDNKETSWTVYGRERDTNFSLATGYNFFGIPQAGSTEIVAENLCGSFGNGTYEVTEIQRWVNGGWSAHLCTILPPNINNFKIEKGMGYFLKAKLANTGAPVSGQKSIPALTK